MASSLRSRPQGDAQKLLRLKEAQGQQARELNEQQGAGAQQTIRKVSREGDHLVETTHKGDKLIDVTVSKA